MRVIRTKSIVDHRAEVMNKLKKLRSAVEKLYFFLKNLPIYRSDPREIVRNV